MNAIYPFSEGDRLEDRNSYAYVPYRGQTFIGAWRATRDAAISELPSPRDLPPPVPREIRGNVVETAAFLENQMARLLGYQETGVAGDLDLLVQRFEITGRRRQD